MKSNNTLNEIAISFALYWGFLALIYPFALLKSSPITYYLFLPAGVKLFTILIFRWRAVIGVALASSIRLAFSDPTQPWTTWLLIATFAALSIYMVVELGLRLLKIDGNLAQLRYYQIVLLATFASIVNGIVFAYGISLLTNNEMQGDLFHNSFVAAVGNFGGNALFTCLMMMLIRNKTTIMNFIKRMQS